MALVGCWFKKPCAAAAAAAATAVHRNVQNRAVVAFHIRYAGNKQQHYNLARKGEQVNSRGTRPPPCTQSCAGTSKLIEFIICQAKCRVLFEHARKAGFPLCARMHAPSTHPLTHCEAGRTPKSIG
jgi:hypothetical protein